MDKYEFRVSLNEINSLVQERRFEEAAEIADTIDWRKVKSPDTLCRISDIYKICKDYERARDILDLANQRNPHTPKIVYNLCELTIFLYGQTGSQSDLAKALGLRQEYESECPDDPKRLILEYKFYKVSPVTLNEKIATLEQLRDEDPSARWEYELASLYHQAGQDDLALAECGNIQRNYDGKFADKAAALANEISPAQQAEEPAPAEQSAPVERPAAVEEPAPVEEPVQESAPVEEASPAAESIPEEKETLPVNEETTRIPETPRKVIEEAREEEPMQAEPVEETPASDDNLSVGQVYDEWERIRRDIRRRNDEQRAQRIMQDTGPLLQDFDETARHGLIEAIEKDAARARRQVRSGASSILGDDGYDRSDRYTDRYNDGRDYRDNRYDDRDAQDNYYNDAPRRNQRSYEPLPSQDDYYPEDNEPGDQYPEDRYADDQYTDSASSEESYVEEPQAPQEDYAEENAPEERDDSITAETVHVGPESNDQAEPRRGSAFAAAVAGAAVGAGTAHLVDEAEDVATRRWNSDEIRGALAAAKATAEATKDVAVDGITTAENVAENAAAPAAPAEPAQPAFDPAAERARIEAEVRAQIAAEQEAARKAAEEEAARKAAAEEAARKAAEEEAARKAAEEQARKEAEEAARKAAEEEAARKAAEERIRKEAEEKARKDAEEAARAQMYAEIEARVRAEYEQKAQAEAEAKAQAEAAQKAAAEEAARKAAEEEAARKAAEAAAIAAAAATAAVAEPETDDVVEESVEELADDTDDGINQISPEEEPDVPEDNEPEEDEESHADEEAEAVEHRDVDTAEYDDVTPVDTDAHEGDDSDEIAERHIPENRPVGAAQSNFDDNAPASAASSIATANDKAPSPEELRLFGPFYRMKENREQVTTALDRISLASCTGNLIITGNAVTARRVAQGLLELTREADSNFTGKIAKATGTALNGLTEEKFRNILSKIENGALIIEHASAMDEGAVQRLYNELEGRDHGVIVVLMDAKKPLDEFLENYRSSVSSFTARVDIRPLNDRALVEYGKDYANSKDYSLDEMAELALSSRISSMQSPSHRVTLKEVRDIVDEAITHASRKTPHALIEVLSRKRYDADDRIILKEKDFQQKA